jgi:plasmid stabilization system protein ParE
LDAELGDCGRSTAAKAAQTVRLIFSHGAIADLERLRAFLQTQNPDAAQRAIRSIEEAVQSLVTFPTLGRPSGIAHLRELIVPFGQSAYILRYAHLPQEDAILVVRIWHGRENR